ncbi:MAG: glycosyltransferase [Flavobacteriales bacterium]|jgi:predicted glycosyltransferase|nr:glycosyltransferase [Flavobacteriales bacterium]
MFRGARIAIAPLDWGLGHATRVVPIIQRLLEMDARPVVLADRAPLALLREAFPALPFAVLPGVTVRYAKGRSQVGAIAKQFPAMVGAVRREHAAFQRLHQELRLDAVISDNRFGVRAVHLPSVLITHQVFPFTPVVQGVLRRINRAYIGRFDACWVMDAPEAPGLAGDLSHGPQLPANARYIGPVSRMAPVAGAASPAGRTAGPYRVVAVISGPEPQRTLLEAIITDQLRGIDGDHLVVRGLPGGAAPVGEGSVRCVPHLPALELARAMAGAELIVARSGYTTLMDLHALGRGALLVPTPGQPEQEYLARLHGATGRHVVQPQHAVDIAAALGRAATVRREPPPDLLGPALEDLARRLR